MLRFSLMKLPAMERLGGKETGFRPVTPTLCPASPGMGHSHLSIFKVRVTHPSNKGGWVRLSCFQSSSLVSAKVSFLLMCVSFSSPKPL